MNQGQADAGVETRLHTMRILWAVFLNAVFLFALVAYFGAPDEPGPRGDSSVPTYMLIALGLFNAAFSFALRQSFFNKGAREKRPEHVQTGLVAALALCEVAALLGVVAVIALADPLGYLLFALAALCDLLHFPRRDPLLAASPGRALG